MDYLTTNITDRITDHFRKNDTLTKDDVAVILSDAGMVSDDNAVYKRIYLLKNIGLIRTLKSGIFTLVKGPVFTPTPDKFMIKLNKIFSTQYPDPDNYLIWSSEWLHNFMVNQPFSYFYIFEVEKDMLESTFNLFQQHNLNVFLNPEHQVIEKYAIGKQNIVILKPVISRSPSIFKSNFPFPRLEKILVDVFCDKDIFYIYQGNELKNIFQKAILFYQLDYSRLLNYADRRKQKGNLKNYLSKNISNINIDLLI